MDSTAYTDLTLDSALRLMTYDGATSEDVRMLQRLSGRIASTQTEHSVFTEWCRRADALYYTTSFTDGGADLWPDDPSASTPGRVHISVNTPATYVDVPAALQAVTPIENMLATKDSPEARHAAAATERIYKAWKSEERFELKFHKATTIKALYGKTAGYVYYDREKKRPCVDVIQNPRNLHLGFKDDDYEEVEWAAHVTLQDPSAIMERYSVEFTARTMPDGKIVPWVVGEAMADRPRPEMNFGPARVEVWDYWYRMPGKLGKRGRATKMETWNVVIAGNGVIRGPYKYPEYDGAIPYLPLFNTFIPGTPTGRSELHDMEHLIRETYERITGAAQMIAGATAGDYWQLVGPEAPSRLPQGLKPRRGEVVTPGAGNHIETITPFVVQFQLEQYLGRLDREKAVVSGLNDLLLGLAPSQVLSSSKAINALISNYESRLSMRRMLLYAWRRDIWERVFGIYAKMNKDVKAVLDAGGGTLDIIDPSLSPRDEGETAIRAANLVNAKLWSQARGMDAVGVDDPEQEQAIIREERTDASMFPADVQVMAQLLGALQSLGIQAPASAQDQAQAQLGRGQNDLRAALGAATPQGDTSTQGAEMQGQVPPDALTPGAPAPNSAPFAQPPAGAAAPGAYGGPVLQGMIQNGKASGRLLTQSKLGRR